MAYVTAVTVHGPLSLSEMPKQLGEWRYKTNRVRQSSSRPQQQQQQQQPAPWSLRRAEPWDGRGHGKRVGTGSSTHTSPSCRVLPRLPTTAPQVAQLQLSETASSEDAAVVASSFEILHPSGIFTRIRPAHFKQLTNARSLLRSGGQARRGARGG